MHLLMHNSALSNPMKVRQWFIRKDNFNRIRISPISQVGTNRGVTNASSCCSTFKKCQKVALEVILCGQAATRMCYSLLESP